jgi:methionyl-tRNA formyltransferase
MIKIVFFTSGKYTHSVAEVLKKAKDFNLLKVYSRLPSLNQIPKADLFLVADFGEILNERILSLPKYGALCLHPSLLPKYRSASPVPASILNGDKETGITIFKMDSRVDHGPIIDQVRAKILPDDNAGSLYIRLFSLGANRLKKVLPDYVAGKMIPLAQNHKRATYTQKLAREDGKIDWKKPAVFQERFIRAMSPWPGSWTQIKLPNGQIRRLKILKANLQKGKLILDIVQLEGKKPVSFKQFKEGYPGAKIIS